MQCSKRCNWQREKLRAFDNRDVNLTGLENRTESSSGFYRTRFVRRSTYGCRKDAKEPAGYRDGTRDRDETKSSTTSLMHNPGVCVPLERDVAASALPGLGGYFCFWIRNTSAPRAMC